MTSRDLLQQRMMSTNGDSIWQPSPLIIAAMKGHLAVLDGIHRINPGTLSVLQRHVTKSSFYKVVTQFELQC